MKWGNDPFDNDNDDVEFEGFRISFLERPKEPYFQGNMTMRGEAALVCHQEVMGLLGKRAIEKIAWSEKFFVSGFFIIPKSSGGHRPVVNLRKLNEFFRHQHFKMEGVGLLKETIRQNDYFVKIDLRDAYLSIPVHIDDRKFLQFTWKNEIFHFTTLAFGFSAAPWAFKKILKPVISHLRSEGMRLIIYLDDMLILNQSREGARNDFLRAVGIFLRCVFLINEEKSKGDPSQRIEYLGLLIDSWSLSLFLKRTKADH